MTEDLPGTRRSTSDGPFIRLLRYCAPHRQAIALATLFSVLNKLFDLAPPLLIGAAVDIVVSKETSFVAKLGVTAVDSQLWLLAAITLAIWAAESLFEYAFALAWRRLAQKIQHELRIDLYAHVQSLEMAYFEDRSTGGLMAILNDDVNQLERFLDDGANQLIQLITTITVVGTMIFVVVPSVAWMAMLPMPVVIWGSIWFQRKLEPRYAQVRQHVSLINGQLANNLSGIATIKSYSAEDYEVGQIEARSRAYEHANREAIKLSSAFVPLIRMLIVVGFCAILIYGGRLALSGQLNVGVYSVLVFMTQRLLWPLTRLGNMLDQYQRAMASVNRAMDVLDTDATIRDASDAIEIEHVTGTVEFDHVDFSYRDTEGTAIPVLSDLSLTIKAGQTVAFIGATGAGKSTLIKLILRFYETTDGTIRLDGHDLRHLTLSSLRRSIGLVSQDVFLFHGTVRDNISYGSFGASDEQIREAAEAAEASGFINALPGGYDTIVGERGQKLSGGQRQRIAIARAILRDPRVLILDEATSSVDNETEAAIQRSLDRIAIGRTTIVVAHRLSTVRNADCTYVLGGKGIVEFGTHDQLVAKNGRYAALWRVQTGERLAS